MGYKLNMSLKKERKRVRMRTYVAILIWLAVIFQLLTFAAVLVFGGAFRDLEEYSYHTLADKAESGSTYIQNELQKKSALVEEYAERVVAVVEDLLDGRNASAADLQRDGELAGSVLESSVQLVSGLLRRTAADEAYLILDTGGLYENEAKAALCLRNTDPLEDGEVQLVLGLSEEHGLTLYSGWSELLIPDRSDEANFGFYDRTMQTARENTDLTQNELGLWSGFSAAVPGLTESMKFTLPLIAEDGTVYGVLGIGLTEENVMSGIPADDDTDCYVLASRLSDESFALMASTGTASKTLLGGTDTLRISGEEGEGVYRFDTVSDAQLVGSVRALTLYGKKSPYADEKWTLLCVADRSSLMQPLLFMQRMLAASGILSLIVAAAVAGIGGPILVKPLTNLVKQIRGRRKYNEAVRFAPTNVYEIDEITDAITQMEINVQGFSSQVSKMISVADVGLGTFMYDRTDDSVFVGQSLIKVLGLGLRQGEDVVMTRREFLDSIENTQVRSLIAAGLGMAGGEIKGDQSKVYEIGQPDGSTFWMRLGYTYSLNTAIGIVQDITDTMVEKNRIEYERDHDQLTGLLNRPAYYRLLEEIFRDREALKVTAIIMLDLDNLKFVNDTYGHAFGDDYIKTAANALKKFQDHGGVVARLSGDEFNVCLHGFSTKEEVRRIIDHVRGEFLKNSCPLADGTDFKVSGSMGVAWYPDDAGSRELLMKYADFAMYTVKRSAKGGIAEFDRKALSEDSAKLTDLEELNRVIEGSRVRYAFQSIVRVETGEVYGYEALMRVQSDIFRSPRELLNIAKARAKLYEIERLTWTKSLADFGALTDAGRIKKTARLFINSVASLKLEKEVLDGLERTYPDLLPQVVLEILESESADNDSIIPKKEFIRKWGGQFALDDYGAGCNSEYAFVNLQPDIIKIDRSIVSGCDQDAARRVIIENLVKLARGRGILVLAEGVETLEEMKTAIACGVDFLQGYYLARPVFEPEPLPPELAGTIRRLAATREIPNES